MHSNATCLEELQSLGYIEQRKFNPGYQYRITRLGQRALESS